MFSALGGALLGEQVLTTRTVCVRGVCSGLCACAALTVPPRLGVRACAWRRTEFDRAAGRVLSVRPRQPCGGRSGRGRCLSLCDEFVVVVLAQSLARRLYSSATTPRDRRGHITVLYSKRFVSEVDNGRKSERDRAAKASC